MKKETVLGALYRAGATLQKLAMLEDRSVCTVRNRLIQEGVDRRHRGNPGIQPPTYDALYDHVFRGMTDP